MRQHLYLVLVERSQREVQSVQRDGWVDDAEADNVLTPVLPPTCRGSGLGLGIRDLGSDICDLLFEFWELESGIWDLASGIWDLGWEI